MAESATRRVLEGVWRRESARIIGRLVRLVGDVDTAEELANDALVVALERWPVIGIPANPGAWLTTVAKQRAIDLVRRRDRLKTKHDDLARSVERDGWTVEDDVAAVLDDDRLPDDVLGLMLMACHPVLSPDARVGLTLRLVGGLTTDDIARAFLVPEPTMAQRIVRAKRTIAAANVPFEVPGRGELSARLTSVLDVIFLIFNAGYAAPSGDEWMRPSLCEEALRLGRILSHLAPDEPEVHGLVALMEIQASRMAARTGPDGEPILLLDQNRTRWNQLLIRRGLAALGRAEALGGAMGPFALQAAIAACHARAVHRDETDWERMVALYDALAQIAPSPIVELNRAVAVSMAFGPAAALEVVDGLADEPELASYHLAPSVRGDLLAKLGRIDEARREFERAAALAENQRERTLLLDRAAACQDRDSREPP